jgi:hypothetical protein
MCLSNVPVQCIDICKVDIPLNMLKHALLAFIFPQEFTNDLASVPQILDAGGGQGVQEIE